MATFLVAHGAWSAGWAWKIDASHNPHITAPEALAALLDGIAG
jgi:hypothetical protein